MLLLWEQGAFKNEVIWNAMGISYSGGSKSVPAIKKQIEKDNRLKICTKGNKRLFSGRWLHDHWDWEKHYPVIHISFGGRDQE